MLKIILVYCMFLENTDDNNNNVKYMSVSYKI